MAIGDAATGISNAIQSKRFDTIIRYGNSAQQKPCIQSCGQTVADKNMITIDNL